MIKKIISEKTAKKIFINGKEIPDITDISKLPWFIKKFIDQDNNGKIDVIEKAEKDGLIDVGAFSNLHSPANQIQQSDPFKSPGINKQPNISINPNKGPILVPQDGVENKMRLVGLMLLAGVVAYIIYKLVV